MTDGNELEQQLKQLDQVDDLTRAKILGETARIAWRELQPHFARGVVIMVDASLSLIDVAMTFSKDDEKAVGVWMKEGLVGQVPDAQAAKWYDADETVWAVVTNPFVLVQQQPAV